MYNWPLNLSNLTWSDRFKICKFFLNPSNKLTQGKYTNLLEEKMAEFIECKYSVITSSGSTANTILAMDLRDSCDKKKNIVVLPSVSWQTSYSPFIREGFKPKFIDISLNDFSMDLDLLEEYLSQNSHKVALVFVTTLLGFAPDIKRLLGIQNSYKVKIMLDNCEANLTQESFYSYNVSASFTSTTSMYFGHHLQTSEMGFIFTDSKEDYKRYLLYRNHGMVRSLDRINLDWFATREYKNDLVDPRFDFYLLGNNFRNSDINSFIGLLDFERRYEYTEKRRKLYDIYYNNLNNDRYILPYYKPKDVAFSLPIICKGQYPEERKKRILDWCEENSIETRPIVSSNILRHTPYQKYDNYKNYPMAELLTNQGCYVGLHTKLKEKDILFLTENLNKL